jgi:signal peptidase I
MLWALGRLDRFRVSGPSMEPALTDGDTVLVDPRGAPAVGDIVIARHPSQDTTVAKRVDHITDAGAVFLKGDGTVSTDSRDYGPLPPDRVLGVVRCTFP